MDSTYALIHLTLHGTPLALEGPSVLAIKATTRETVVLALEAKVTAQTKAIALETKVMAQTEAIALETKVTAPQTKDSAPVTKVMAPEIMVITAPEAKGLTLATILGTKALTSGVKVITLATRVTHLGDKVTRVTPTTEIPETPSSVQPL